MRQLSVLLCSILATAPLQAQTAPPPTAVAPIAVSGSLRTRVEAWDWFDADANGEYAFSGSLLRLGFRHAAKRYTWNVELAVPVLLGVPDDAVAAGAQGQLGLGASYFAANDNSRNAAALFPKQAFVRLNDLGGTRGQSLTLGRMEFVDGTEVTPKMTTLAVLKRDRIAHRLIGNFAFSHVGRSIDGAQYVHDTPVWNLTAVGGRPTQGVFQVNGWGELDINLAYAALTHSANADKRAAEWRAFAIAYDDRREGVLKTDNRSAAVRRADTDRIAIATVGGHYLDLRTTDAGTFDLLVWGAAQTGSWGVLDHRAVAFAAEAGWQPSGTPRLRPWIHGGYDFGSGDGDPSDARHGTFFQVLPTPRVYARLPFFNMMNTEDAFGELVLRPSPRLTVRTDVHALRLADANDLWYSGGGAFQPATFGYAGRPSGGGRALSTLVDASADFVVNPRATVGGYFGVADGGEVVDAIYPNGSAARLGYIELTVRF